MLHRQGASWSSDECNPSVQLLIASAERELSSFFLAVQALFGVEWAHRSALAWIEEMSSLEWPENDAMPNWRKATLGASIRLASSMPGNHSEG
jgi:hypothetical protein